MSKLAWFTEIKSSFSVRVFVETSSLSDLMDGIEEDFVLTDMHLKT